MRSLFVVLEGADGSGKSTLSATLAENFFGRDNCRIFFEPTDKTDAGRKIRSILKSAAPVTPEVSAELMELFYIDRLWDIEYQIKPTLRQGRHVILDRYFYSTAAYQAATPEAAERIAHEYLNDCRVLAPDILIYLDIDPQTALQRIGNRSANRDIFETEQQLQKVINNYRRLFAVPPHNSIILDATLTTDEIYRKAKEAIQSKIPPRIS